MVKKIGKKKLLTLLTVAAVVVTMAGSYAMWDQLSATDQGTLTLEKPITTTMAVKDFSTPKDRDWSETPPTYTSEATYTTANIPADKTTKVVLTPTIKNVDQDVTSHFTVAIKKNTSPIAAGTATGTFEDTAVGASNTYSISITPIDTESDHMARDLAENATALTVDLEAKLQDTTTK